VAGKLEMLQRFVLRSRFTRPNDPLYRDLSFDLQSRFTRSNDPLYHDLLYASVSVPSSTGAI
jgi:hypothetical protein